MFSIEGCCQAVALARTTPAPDKDYIDLDQNADYDRPRSIRQSLLKEDQLFPLIHDRDRLLDYNERECPLDEDHETDNADSLKESEDHPQMQRYVNAIKRTQWLGA